MNFFDPAPTPLDLRWRMLGIDVRVHPSFWLIMILLGLGSGSLLTLLLWVLCGFVSVLIHELGHVTMGRAFGEPGHILLYGMGGYAIGMYDRLDRRQRILVSFAGPAMGFLFLILIIHVDNRPWNVLVNNIFLENRFGRAVLDFLHMTDPPEVRWSLLGAINEQYGGSAWYRSFGARISLILVLMNLYWNVLNLLPIYPLDGGNILREVCTGVTPRSGLRFAFGFGFLVAGVIAVYSLLCSQRPDLPYFGSPTFNLVMFGMLSVQNFILLRSAEAEERRWSPYDDY